MAEPPSSGGAFSYTRPSPVGVLANGAGLNQDTGDVAAGRAIGSVPHRTSGGALLLRVPDDVLLSHGIHHTIIGAEAFHGPVRNGKGWVQLAMAAKQFGHRCSAATNDQAMMEEAKRDDCCASMPDNLQGYRIKPHGQLVPVS